MRTSHAIGLLLGMGSLIAIGGAAAAGCGSTQRAYIPPEGENFEAGPIFGGEGGEGSKPCTGRACDVVNCGARGKRT